MDRMNRMNNLHPLVLATTLLLVAGCGQQSPSQLPAANPVPAAPASSGPVESNGSATIFGRVLFKGTPPPSRTIIMTADAFCATAHPTGAPTQTVLVNSNGTLQNVFVYVKQGLPNRSYPPPRTAISLDQKGCMYTPHVLGVQVGQTLEVRNSDDTLHNINAAAVANMPFNTGQPIAGMVYRHIFKTREVMIKVICNVHPWMVAYVGVLDHPFFGVTGTDGTFLLSPLPAGTYTIEAWHEKYGKLSQTVTVGEKETKGIDIEFKDAVPTGSNPPGP